MSGATVAVVQVAAGIVAAAAAAFASVGAGVRV